MPSTYTTRNRAEKQAPGENNNSWGSLLNAGTIDMFDQALDGMVSFTLSTTRTLSTANGSSDEARCRYVNISGGSGGTVTLPNVEKVYVVRNAASGSVTFTTGSGTTCAVTAGRQAIVVCEGGNVCRAFEFVTIDPTLAALASFNSNGLLTQTAADTFAGRTIAAGSAKISIANGDGVAGNPTVNLGAVASADLSDGGSLYKAGGTDVAVADGGTGASDAAGARTNLGLAAVAASGSASDLSSGTLAIARGGTGAASAAAALAALGGVGVVGSSLGATGYVKFDIGGTTLILQWGQVTAAANGTTAISYPTAFASWLKAWCNGGRQDSAAQDNDPFVAGGSGTTTGATIFSSRDESITCDWFAVGI